MHDTGVPLWSLNGRGIRIYKCSFFLLLDPNKQDRLENVQMRLSVGAITPDTIEVKWTPEDASRVNGYIIYYRAAGKSLFVEKEVKSATASSYVLRGLKQNTRYELEIKALNDLYYSNPSPPVEATTLRSE